MNQHTTNEHFPENMVGANLDFVHKVRVSLLEENDILLKEHYVQMVY